MATLLAFFMLSFYSMCDASRLLTSLNYSIFWNVVTQPSLPRGTEKMAMGYDPKNDTIWIIGGFSGLNGQQLVSFANDDFTDFTRHYFPLPTIAIGQAYRQINQYVYSIHHPDGSSLDRFNVETATMEYDYLMIPRAVTFYGCVTSININEGYLVVMGGAPDNATLNNVQIYDIGNDTWLSNVPFLQLSRINFGCNVDNKNKQLYAIGGSNGDSSVTIEVLNVYNLSNIHNEEWKFIQNMSNPKGSHRTVVYGNNIIIVGGSKEIYNIDTSNNQVTEIGYLDVEAANYSGVILVNNILYVFGGYAIDGSLLSSWRYISLPLSIDLCCT